MNTNEEKTQSELEALEAKERQAVREEQEEAQQQENQSLQDTQANAPPTTPYPGDVTDKPSEDATKTIAEQRGEGTTAKSSAELRGGVDKVDDGNNKVQGPAQKPALPGARGVERHVHGPSGWVYGGEAEKPAEGQQRVEDRVPVNPETQATIDKEKAEREKAERQLIDKSKEEVPELVRERDIAAGKRDALREGEHSAEPVNAPNKE